MPFSRPTLPDLIERISSDFVSRLSLTGSIMRRSVVYVLARVIGGAAHGIYGNLDFISRQIFPDTSEAEYLERQANLFRIFRTPADYAVGNITVTGTNGTVIPEGTLLQRSDGAQYETDALATISGGTALIAVTAVVAGDDGNADVGTTLSFVSPISGANASAAVAVGGLSGGTDPESDDALRIRLLERLQSPPHGGADFDYIAWAKEIPGVTRVWVYPLELGAGKVTVRFVRDGDDDIIPSGAEVDEVQDYIDTLRPVTADVTVLAPVPVELDFSITLSPDSAAIRDAVEAELRDLLTREAEPGGTILISHIREAISVAAGENDHILTSPTANVEHDTGEIAVMGDITWG